MLTLTPYGLQLNYKYATILGEIITQWMYLVDDTLSDSEAMKALADELRFTFLNSEWLYWKTNRRKDGQLKQRHIKLRQSEVAILLRISLMEWKGLEMSVMIYVVSELEQQKHRLERNRLNDLSDKYEGLSIYEIVEKMKIENQ